MRLTATATAMVTGMERRSVDAVMSMRASDVHDVILLVNKLPTVQQKRRSFKLKT